jgi:hypothetical protein
MVAQIKKSILFFFLNLNFFRLEKKLWCAAEITRGTKKITLYDRNRTEIFSLTQMPLKDSFLKTELNKAI